MKPCKRNKMNGSMNPNKKITAEINNYKQRETHAAPTKEHIIACNLLFKPRTHCQTV